MLIFKATKSPVEERLLADTFGYPKSWHVVRTVNFHDGNSTFFDTIYSGDPRANSDTYYNHLAAMDAAMKWKEGESTNYDDNGGQMLPIQSEELGVGDEVEVYYEPDAAYYAAVVKKLVHYKDDIRYTVKYKVDRSTQSNICIDSIRLIKSKKKGKKPKKTIASNSVESDIPAESSKSRGNKRKSTKAVKNSSAKKQKKVAATANPTKFDLAEEMGLPEGWSVTVAPKSRFTFCSPNGKKFYSKKAVFTHLGKNESPKKGRIKSSAGKKSKSRLKKNVKDAFEALVEEGDPPWRTDGHKFLSKRIQYEVSDGYSAFGTVTGWISKDDKDKEGEAGFISETSGKPAALFHVTFDTNSRIASQDLEEYEVVECLVDDDDEEE